MKFKYNYLENKLWRIEGKYSYEISEENQFCLFGNWGFKLGENKWIAFDLQTHQIAVMYVELEKNGTVYYEKKIKRMFPEIETIFEFSEQDRLDSS